MKIRPRHTLLAAFVVVCGHLLYTTYDGVRERTLVSATERLLVHASQAARGIEEFFGYHVNALNYLAGLDAVRVADERGRELLHAFLENATDVRAVTRVDAAGRILYTVPYDERAIGADLSHQDHVRNIMAHHRPVVSEVFRAVQGYTTVALHVPVFRGGAYDGSLAILLPFDVLARKFLQDVRIGESGHAWVVTRGGMELYCRNPGHVGRRADPVPGGSAQPDILDAMTRGERGAAVLLGTPHRETGPDPARYRAGFTPIHIGDTTWSIAVATQEEEILLAAREFRNRWLLVAGVLAAGVLVYAYFAGKAIAVVRQARERERAEEILRRSNETLVTVLESMDADVYVADMDDHEILFMNRRMRQRFGDGLVGKVCWREFRGTDQPCPHCTNADLVDAAGQPAGPRVWEGYNPVVDRWYLNHDRAVRWADGRVVRLQLATDITERKRDEERLQFQNSLLQAQNDASIDGILVADPRGAVLSANRRFAEMWQIPDPVLRTGNENEALTYATEQLSDPAGFLAKVRHLYAHPEEQSRDEILFRDGRVFDRFSAPVRTEGGAHLGRLWIFRDVTEQRRQAEERRALEAKMQQTQRLESLGVLAGGIAHDFNNLLMAVVGYADLALQELPGAAPGHRHVEKIQTAATRAAELTNQMLAYSGRGRFVVEPTDLNRLVREMVHLLEASITKKARLVLDLLEHLPPVTADANQLRQVVMNLITNASESLGEGSGTIRVATARVEVTASELASEYLDGELPPGLYVRLEVADTGCGMDGVTRARLFDPFYTTKFTGRGLGLAAVLGIVRGHRGTIHVESAPGHGTTMRVLLPAAQGPPVAEPAPEALEPGQSSAAGATVLVVDDEPSVRDVARGILEQAGATVLEAADGRQALEVFRERGGRIDLVLLDMTMPHMAGPEAFERLRQMRADVAVILCSGYDEQDATGHFKDARPAAFLQKPYRAAALLRSVEKVLAPL